MLNSFVRSFPIVQRLDTLNETQLNQRFLLEWWPSELGNMPLQELSSVLMAMEGVKEPPTQTASAPASTAAPAPAPVLQGHRPGAGRARAGVPASALPAVPLGVEGVAVVLGADDDDQRLGARQPFRIQGAGEAEEGDGRDLGDPGHRGRRAAVVPPAPGLGRGRERGIGQARDAPAPVRGRQEGALGEEGVRTSEEFSLILAMAAIPFYLLLTYVTRRVYYRFKRDEPARWEAT